jgi:D-glutamate cyclase
MTTDDTLAAVLAAVQTDPGRRGLATVPGDNLFTATAADFAAGCRKIVAHRRDGLNVITGFYIPTGEPPAFETDGPLGGVFLARAARALGIEAWVGGELPVERAVHAVLPSEQEADTGQTRARPVCIAIERSGPGADGVCRTMRGADITAQVAEYNRIFEVMPPVVAVGDGGNEIGMGKIPTATVAANVPDGGRIHCVVPAEFLVVAGVSNWGAYALAAGLFVLRGERPPAGLFDPDAELRTLETMVKEGPLVDGVTGRQTATVDGLTWDEYVKPLVRLREILAA